MNELKSFHDTHQWAWDATSLAEAQTCLRKYYYGMVIGLQPKNKSVHLIFGGIYASALEAYYKFRADGDDYETALSKTVRLTMELSWEKGTDENGPFSRPIHLDDAKKTRPSLIRTVIWYLEQYGDEHEDGLVTYHLASGKPAVELSFSIELSDELVYCGHLDRVVSMGKDLYVMDQKTTGGTVSNYYFKQFDYSLQMSGYAFAGKMILNTPVRGVIIDAAQIAVNSTQFGRGITTRTADQIEEWLQDINCTIESAWRAADANYFPKNYSSCGNYGGCPFIPLCTNSASVRENYIRSDYVKRSWDPIEQR